MSSKQVSRAIDVLNETRQKIERQLDGITRQKSLTNAQLQEYVAILHLKLTTVLAALAQALTEIKEQDSPPNINKLKPGKN